MTEDRAAEHVIMGGDWNEPPTSTGRWSPRWIADATGQTIYPPPAGKHGRIDFLMTDLDFERVNRIPGGESDHGLILYDLQDPATGTRYRVAIWNVQVGRPARARAVMIDHLAEVARGFAVDVFLLQECSGYHSDLKRLAKATGYTYVGSNVRGPWHNVTLVHRRTHVSGVRFKQMSRSGWRTRTGATHTPTYTTLCTLDRRIRVANVHEAVSVDWRDGRPVGPENRVRARIESAARLVAIGRRVRRNRRRRHHS
jgi:hypothetical protein